MRHGGRSENEPGLRGVDIDGVHPALGVRLAAFNSWAYMQIAEQWQKAWAEAMAFGPTRANRSLTHSILMTGLTDSSEYFFKLRPQS